MPSNVLLVVVAVEERILEDLAQSAFELVELGPACLVIRVGIDD